LAAQQSYRSMVNQSLRLREIPGCSSFSAVHSAPAPGSRMQSQNLTEFLSFLQ